MLLVLLCGLVWAAEPTWEPVGWDSEQDFVKLGSRLELFVDDFLLERLEGAELRLNKPRVEEVALVLDAPWEGNTSAYASVLQTPEGFFMYYRASGDIGVSQPEVTCVATSPDGLHWSRPELGLYEAAGTRANNIILMGEEACHNFAPFYDTNPACPPEQRYKALGGSTRAWQGHDLIAYVSADGLHWQRLREEAVITEGAFDSLNVSFWDEVRGCYMAFPRDFTEGRRTFRVTWSEDFLAWAPSRWSERTNEIATQLYTTAIRPYFRAPHLLLGFPKRFFEERKVLPERPYPGISDAGFMTSRDAVHFYLWPEAFVRPGLDIAEWADRSHMVAAGLAQTGDQELSLYISERYQSKGARFRRLSLPLDRFASLQAGSSGGEVITKLFTFEGSALRLNCSTSAGGSVQVEIQDRSGAPVPGFELERCHQVIGDGFELAVDWEGEPALARLAGTPVRLRLALVDADVYAFRFGD